MDIFSARRMAENEMAFRHANEKNGNREKRSSEDLLHDFYCECSDAQCRERIRVDLQTYKRLHASNSHFIALPGHENRAIEEVVARLDGFNVIQKYVDPSDLGVPA